MSDKPRQRRLIDLPGVDPLELKALMKRGFAEPEARAEYPEIDECSLKNLGITADQAEATTLPDGLDAIWDLPPLDQVAAFEAEGWDVTDNKRRPLRVLNHFNRQLWLAIHGVAGELPYHAEQQEGAALSASLAAEAARFRKR